MPTTAEEAKEHEKEMAMAGFHGAVGSSDATHIGMEKCSAWLRPSLRRPKLALPKRFFRGRLVENFNILFWDGQVVWPERTGAEQPFLGYS